MAYKIWNIVKDVLLFLIVWVILISITFETLSNTPENTKPFQVTINTFKIVEPGVTAGTVPITIEGSYKEYFFNEQTYHPDEIDLNISTLDGYSGFVPSGMDATTGKVLQLTSRGYCNTLYYAYKDGRPYSISISFTKDFNYWRISVSQWDAFYSQSEILAYYMGSTNNNDTLEDIDKVFGTIDYQTAWEKEAEPTN